MFLIEIDNFHSCKIILLTFRIYHIAVAINSSHLYIIKFILNKEIIFLKGKAKI